MSDEGKSFRLRYVGARFDDARLPVDVLSDLPAFRDLLVAFAKDGWRALNSDRQRVPKGFDKSLSFDLVAIEPGSAIPKLDWNRRTAQSQLPGFADELEQIVGASFKEVVSLIDGAGHDRFPKFLPSEHIRALNKLGSGLREGERIEFQNTQGTDGKVVYLDSYRRKKLITEVRETYQARFEGVGMLVGTKASDGKDGYIVVKTVEHGEIEISVDLERVVKEFDGNIYGDVQFELQIELDHNDRYRGVIEVHDVGLIDAQIGAELLRCRARLADIRNLRDGWHEGGGLRIHDAAVAAAEKFLLKRPSLCGAYKIYPTEEGDVLFEFESNGWDFSLEFGETGNIEIYGIQVDGPGEMEPLLFDEIGDDFMKEFDSRVGR
ncbi:hypothetical protein PQR21_27535 [Paraburkholderia nemoris]|uniref:hypothetical protein n=1 Tax=Paraburkholderia nemoris TaxID=2793076 RepID=UPI0038BC925A